ncbi:bacterio-opsin activator domain-containing protein [Natronosalvus halobius]|uniref:helix-turn-helix domain-containing protein n=1 Tax=Natronosalvus halobius TaxID=2953746 RepID=UPI00209EDE2B|nr:bacterio-opsin activator domain-containing protein [Natronosalvus halobius]USZ71651.1 helix-turn-helix domain-containing protein [Natronosalvus halobius]
MRRSPNAKRSASAVEVTFSVSDDSYPFVAASTIDGCEIELAKLLPRDDGRFAEYFTVTGAETSRIRDLAANHASMSVSLLESYDRGGLFEFLVSVDCPAVTLATCGALPREVRGVDGEGRIVAEIPSPYDAGNVIETFLEETAGASLVSKRETGSITPLFTESSFEQVLEAQLTDRQHEVLEVAYDAGYYDWPRTCTGEEVAERLDITSATFSEHIHTAERKLLTMLFSGS